MNYRVRCMGCGATCWVPGSYDFSCNALELDENALWEYGEDGDLVCDHDGDFEVIDEEYEPRFYDDVI